MNKIYNEDCFDTLGRNIKFNVVMTSPPYNTSRKTMSQKAMDNYECRYNVYEDFKSADEYIQWTVNLFNKMDKSLEENGVILYNISYSSENVEKATLMWRVVAEIINNTEFATADCIIWKKSNALPNNVSHNKLTRIVEYVFVFVRKKEFKTFQGNKEVSSIIEKTGQKMYKNVYNYVEAKNNDGSTKLNKATYSSELCEKLLSIYAKEGNIVYDPFSGTGSTFVACKNLGLGFIGSEIDSAQVEFSQGRLNEVNN